MTENELEGSRIRVMKPRLLELCGIVFAVSLLSAMR